MHSWSTFGATTHHGQLKHTRLTTTQTWGKPSPSPLQYTLWLSMGATSKWLFVLRLPSGSPEIPAVGTFVTLGAHNLACKLSIAMRSEAKLQPSLRAFQQYVTHYLHARKSGQFFTFCAGLTFDFSFGHNLCFRCPNGQCEPNLNIFALIAFQ